MSIPLFESTVDIKRVGSLLTTLLREICKYKRGMSMEEELMKEVIMLVKPNEALREQYLDMMEEWKRCEEEIIPWSLNFDPTRFDLLVEKLEGYSKGEGLEEGYVESTTFWMINKSNRILGAIDIRHRLNDNLLFRGGHIGYGIRPSERQKGYATKMLSLALQACKTMGIQRVLITCAKDNTGSVKTIVNNGGILDSEGIDNGECFQRYWIDLS